MDTNFLNSVLSTENASEFLENLAKAKDQALAGAQEAKGQALEGISGGIGVVGGVIGKATGLSKIAGQSTKQLTKFASDKLAQYGNEAGNALKEKAGQVADDYINSTSASAKNAIASLATKEGTSSLAETSFGGEAGDTVTKLGQATLPEGNPISGAIADGKGAVEGAIADGKGVVQGAFASAKSALQSKVSGLVQQAKSAFSSNSGISGIASGEGNEASFADPSSTGNFDKGLDDVISKLASKENPTSSDYMGALLKAQARGGYKQGAGLLKDNPAITSSAPEELPISSSASSSVSSSASSSVQSGIADIQSKLNLTEGQIPNRFTGNVGKIQGLTSGSKSAVADAGNAVDESVQGAGSAVSSAVEDASNSANSALANASNSASSALANASSSANSALANAGNSANSALADAGNAVKTGVADAGDAVNGAISGATNSVSGALSSASKGVSSAINAGTTAVKTGATDLVENLGATIGGGAVGDEIGGALTATGILAPLGGLIMLGSTIGTAIEGIKDLFEAHSHHTTPDLSGIPQAQMNFGVY